MFWELFGSGDAGSQQTGAAYDAPVDGNFSSTKAPPDDRSLAAALAGLSQASLLGIRSATTPETRTSAPAQTAEKSAHVPSINLPLPFGFGHLDLQLAPKLLSLEGLLPGIFNNESSQAVVQQVPPAVPQPAATSPAGSSGGGGAPIPKIGGGASGSGSKLPIAAATQTATSTPAPTNVPATPVPAQSAALAVATTTALAQASTGVVIEATDVEQLLARAAGATARNDAIIAIVDRNGQILGVRVESGVNITDTKTLVFAIDGAVAKARTAAFFSSDSAPLTSRTVRFISQSTITQREVESNPNITDENSTIRGPGFVAPIGLGGHFPPGVQLTPQVDLFAIEHTNRDGLTHPGPDGVKGTNDDLTLDSRFNADFADGNEIMTPESYGTTSGLLEDAQSRGIATLPGGVPLYKFDATSPNKQRLVGGIGVFFPGPDGYATFEQNFVPASSLSKGQKPQTAEDRVNAPLVLEAEYTAAVVALNSQTIAGIQPLANYVFKPVRIDLAGITLEGIGPHPKGVKGLLKLGKSFGVGNPNSGVNQPLNADEATSLHGEAGAFGWLVNPRASADNLLSEADVRKIIEDGIAEANRVRAQIRPLGSRSRMVLSVTDKSGEILGLFRMDDATFFSIDVAVAKARNVAYYADPQDVERVDRVDANFDGIPEVQPGAAFTNRTFRYLSTPFFPTGVDSQPSGPFSILNETGINPKNGENIGAPKSAKDFTTVLGYDSFNPGSNFRELNDPNAVVGNQNGVVFFPGSTPLYKNGVLVGGLGVSGDGVDQDDTVTAGAAGSFLPSLSLPIQRADEVLVRGVRLPFQKFSRNPHA